MQLVLPGEKELQTLLAPFDVSVFHSAVTRTKETWYKTKLRCKPRASVSHRKSGELLQIYADVTGHERNFLTCSPKKTEYC
ncbi:hypothetical protein DV515_00011909 [Chloebia gouldiae]|uniref:Uncharacterized protein n=1 Tax=Chloebia gouldiae TaxID=44316 RepID=A0A3L8S5U0_CHLGU|nr:hypothetical protein DV515_00011909 [Chloebia gouldiae]